MLLNQIYKTGTYKFIDICVLSLNNYTSCYYNSIEKSIFVGSSLNQFIPTCLSVTELIFFNIYLVVKLHIVNTRWIPQNTISTSAISPNIIENTIIKILETFGLDPPNYKTKYIIKLEKYNKI